MFPPKRLGIFHPRLGGDAQGYSRPHKKYGKLGKFSNFPNFHLPKFGKLESLENMRVLLQPLWSLWGAQMATEIRIAQLKSAILRRCPYLRTSMASVCASSCERGMLRINQHLLRWYWNLLSQGFLWAPKPKTFSECSEAHRTIQSGVSLFQTFTSTADIIGLEYLSPNLETFISA